MSSHRTWLNKQLLVVALSLHQYHMYQRTSRVQVPQLRLQAQDTQLPRAWLQLKVHDMYGSAY